MKPSLWWRRLREPALAIVGALAIGGLLMLFSGHDPISAYSAMLKGSLVGTGFAGTLGRATPIIGLGLAAAVAFRAGCFNLGGEGQFVLGGLAAALVCLQAPLPVPILLPTAILAAALAGGGGAWVAAAAEFRIGVPLLISTLLLNYPIRLLASYLVSNPLRDLESGLPQTHLVPESVRLPADLAGGVSIGLPLVVLLGLLSSWMYRRTRVGYRMRITGLNVRFAEYGGIDVPRLGRMVMFASGAIAGLMGALQVVGTHFRFIDGALTRPLYAWTGLMVALLARSRPLGVVLGGFFFAAVQTGGFGMERAVEVPREISQVIQALIILFVAVGARQPARDLEEGEAHT